MKKLRLSVYLDPQIMARLTDFARRNERSKSIVAEAAIMSFLTPNAGQPEAAFARRLGLLSRQVERLERDLTIALEALALFIRFWLTITPPLPESTQSAAQAKGRERFESFLETLGRRLSKGQSLLREVSIDRANHGVAQQTETTATAQSRPNGVQS
jgi:hypothetical protein